MDSNNYLTSRVWWIDTTTAMPSLTGQVSICNGYLVINKPAQGMIDVYAKQ
jgi:hypothetical protein